MARDKVSESREDQQKLLKDPRRANFCRAILFGADFQRAFLRYADFSKALLAKANFSGADLSNARFLDANLQSAKLDDALIEGTWFDGSLMSEASLRGANNSSWNWNWSNPPSFYRVAMFKGDFTGADIGGADFRGARLVDVALTDANVSFADFEYATFQPLPDALPPIPKIAEAHNLSTIRRWEHSGGLVRLRNRFVQDGYTKQAREVTYVLNQYTGDTALERTLRYIFLELTCHYGMSPGRPLLIIIFLIIAFSLPYMFALRRKDGAGIWLEWDPKRVNQEQGGDKPIRLHTATTIASCAMALYFSLLSTFHIGWREINLGNWITRLQSKEYFLRGTGWVRTLSGVQALICVYLLALAVLSYFGRPFE
jgi:hypothetical protein